MKKRVLCLLLSVIMLLSLLAPIVVFASVREYEGSVSLLQEGDFDIFDDVVTGESVQNASISNIETVIYKALLNVSSSISSLSSYKLSVSQFLNIYCNVINDNPNLFYVSSSFEYRTLSSTGYIYSVYPRYAMSSSEIEDAKIVFEAGVQKAISQVNDDMTDLQKVLTLHDYFCNIARYPSDAQSNDKESYHSAYGIFYDGDTVCAGYTLAFSTVLKRLGIESEYVVSESMQHAWNAVKIDGNWYNVDLTYDDIGYYGDYSTDGAMHHRCFLKSNEALASEIGFYHYDMQTYDDVDCSDTTYDDYFWDDVDTNIVVIDNYYYYLKPNYSTRYASLVKRDAQGNEQTVFASAFKFTYQSLTSSCTDEEGTTHDVKFYEPFLRMVYLDDKIYISAYTQLYSVDSNNKLNNILNTGVATVANLILGLNVINNELAYQNYTSTGDRTALDKYQYFDKCFKVDGDSVYNNYPDVNNDGCVNAKDYALIKQQTSDN